MLSYLRKSSCKLDLKQDLQEEQPQGPEKQADDEDEDEENIEEDANEVDIDNHEDNDDVEHGNELASLHLSGSGFWCKI